MIKRRTLACSLAVLLLLSGACNDARLLTDGGSNNGGTLSTDEASFLAVETDRILDDVLATTFDDRTSGSFFPSSAAPSATVPITTEFSFERTRACPVGGQVTVSGSGEITVDPEVRTAEMSVAGTKSIEECAVQRGDVVYTMNGSAQWDAFWRREGLSLAQVEKHISGSFTVTTSDGRSRECTFELHTVLDALNRSVSVTGTVCGRTIDDSWSRG